MLPRTKYERTSQYFVFRFKNNCIQLFKCEDKNTVLCPVQWLTTTEERAIDSVAVMEKLNFFYNLLALTTLLTTSRPISKNVNFAFLKEEPCHIDTVTEK